MEIQKLGDGIIQVFVPNIGRRPASRKELEEIAISAFFKIGETPKCPLLIRAFLKDNALLLFAEERKNSAKHTGASRRFISFISN